MIAITRNTGLRRQQALNKRWLGYAQPLDKSVEDPRSAPFHLCQPGTHPGDTHLVERLRMTSSDAFSHKPVMLDEIVELFADAPEGVYVDGTLGGAGHAAAVLDANPRLRLVGIDRDPAAITKARSVLARFGDRAKVVHGTFDSVAEAAAAQFPDVPVTAVLLDLGVSSHQLDVAERGFSFRNDGPIDMRMDTTAGTSAADIVNDYAVGDLERVLREGGETRFAARVARAIVAARPLQTTGQLAETVRSAIPAFARRRPGDPARRAFQALRLEVNEELDILERALDATIDALAVGGRCVVLSYHSGEDRIVKQKFAEVGNRNCTCPPALPCVCGAEPRAKLLTRKSRKPSEQEVKDNPRSESARLRAIEIVQPSDVDDGERNGVDQ